MRPGLIEELQEMPREELRTLIALAAGIHAHRDQDGGHQVARVFANVRAQLLTKREVN